MSMTNTISAQTAQVITLDPYTCIAKRNRKYASDCTEVHLNNQGGETLADHFDHFGNLEVVWLQGNRLARIENLENNFRIREVYIQDNRLVSLAGLKTFKFLKVLLASGNQLRNLEKQLALLSRFAFLKKLDLFDNPVAEEPDYRLRLIYHLPQVEILDRHTVKGPERLRAEEVVPNLDKVSAGKVAKPKPAPTSSYLERSCLRMARNIAERRRKDEEAALNVTFKTGIPQETRPPDARTFKEYREDWADAKKKVAKETTRPTSWEKHEMKQMIEKRAKGKAALTRADVEELAEDLANNGIQEVGRCLKSAFVFNEDLWQETSTVPKSALARSLKSFNASRAMTMSDPHPMEAILGEDESATMPIAKVAEWLLTLEWPRHDDDYFDMHMDAKVNEMAQYSGDADALARNRDAVLKHAITMAASEGAKTRKHHVELDRKEAGLKLLKSRTDIFPQKFFTATRQVDAATGKIALKVAMDTRQTSMGAMTCGYH
eukprot:TRINITY_DN35772_c0_g1_i1.p1 TRINITY_DN35772_c0_g1~~TRINITY_DN35772_c0_g1_i1.p1  ORF type:complete len:491 (+),score=91.79 TRINITY_DN35772_c0_g1_i1:153-1625(+)